MHFLWRALIPSWRFFDNVGPAVHLQFKTDTSSWLPFFPASAERHWYQIFIHSEGNLRLALHSLAERLAAEAAEIQDGHEQEIATSVTYLLVVNAIRAQIAKSQMRTKNFQFKILLDNETVLISAQHEAG